MPETSYLPDPKGTFTGSREYACDCGGTGSGGLAGEGSPEGVVTADPGATYYDTLSGDFYVKETGTGNTGWVLLIA